MNSKIPTNCLFEWNHYVSQQCIIPTNRGNITSLNCSDYYVVTFSIHAMEEDYVKCYVHWNGQTIRLLSENMLAILSMLFYPNKENQMFLNNKDCIAWYKKRLTNLQDCHLDSKTPKHT
eukprot:178512_1